MQIKHDILLSLRTFVFVLSASFSFAAAAEKTAHHNFPSAVSEFHDVMAPLWHSPPGEERAMRTCLQKSELLSKVKGIYFDNVPEGVDKDNWKRATDKLQQQVLKIMLVCKNDQSSEAVLSNMHEAFHNLVRLVGHRH